MLVLASALALPAITYAQAGSTADDQTTMDNRRDDDGGRWGWLGLLGLAGLMGLKRSDRGKRAELGTSRQPM